MQCSLNKDHQHLKWRPRKSLTLYQGFPDVQDKQRTQYLLYTKVKVEDAPKILKFPKSECLQAFGFVYKDINGPNHGPVWKTQSFFLNEICTVILWQDYYGKGNLCKSYWSTVGRKFPIGNAYSYTVKKGLFLSVYVDDIKLAGKKQNIHPMWKVLKEFDLGESTSFLDHVFLGCTQRECEISEDIVDNYRTMFESRISAGATEKLPCLENLSISSWSYDMEGHANKCVERYCELANKTTQHLYKVIHSMPQWPSFRRRRNEILVRIVTCVLSNWFWNAYTCWHVLDDPTFNGQWTNLHDRSQNGPKHVINDYTVWSPTFITQVNTHSIVMWETLQNNADWDCFKTPILHEILGTRNLLQVEHCVISKSHTFVPNKLQFRTVQQNHKSFPWMQD